MRRNTVHGYRAAGDSGDSIVTESPYDENGFLRDSLPADLNLGGKTVNIYVRGDNLATEYAVESSGDIVDDAIYAANVAIEERLKVKLNYFANTTADMWNERNKYVDTVRTSVMSNDNSIDIAGALSYMAPYMAQEGLFMNLLASDMPYLDFNQPWWSTSLIDELAVGDKLCYEFGIFHGILLNNITSEIRNVISGAKPGGWASTWASKEAAFNTTLQKFITDINALEQ